MLPFYKKYLCIDLETKTYETVQIDESILKKYGGGKGIGTYLLYNLNPEGVDPFSKDNHIIINVGPAGSAKVWGASRYGIYTKSPLTNCYVDSTSGGHVAKYIDKTGYDAIVIKGKSDNPVSLEINDKDVVFHDASDIWGKDTHISEDILKERSANSDCGACVIGPAAENLCRFGLLKNDYWRSIGRGGVGSVFGSKKLKGIVFYGEAKRPLGDKEKLNKLYKKYLAESKDSAEVKKYRTWGTPSGVPALNKIGAFPTEYWSKGVLENWENISETKMQEILDVMPKACDRCFIACGKLSKTKENSKYPNLTVEGPEYETFYSFGGLCKMTNVEDILYLNDICDKLGMDTMTAGNLVAFAFEASRRGKIAEKYEYGNVEHAAEILNKIAKDEGIGQILSQGIRYAAKQLDLEDIAIHVKGMEPAGYDPRALPGTALGYATSPRGACHLRSGFYKAELSGVSDPNKIEGKAAEVADWENWFCVYDMLIICRFYRYAYFWDEITEIFQALYGDYSITKKDLEEMSNRIISLAKKFNIRENPDRIDELEKLPERFFKEKLENGKVMDKTIFNNMLQEYYEIRNWDSRGIPKD
jgi:aldehyde:ferredoxin oxidoreductase